MEVEGTEAFKLRFKGDTEKKVTKAMNSPYGVVLPEQSVNEMSAKSKKIINKLNKKEKEMFMDMIDIMGFDQVMADYKKDKKAFKQALKDMSEGVIQEKFSVKSSKDYMDNLNTAINLIIRQAQNLKGPLAKHPIKRDINKLKAVKTLLNKGFGPELSAYEREYSVKNSYKAVDMTLLKKRLQDGKFKAAIEYSLLPALDTRSYDSNSFYYMKDSKGDKLRKRLVDVLYDMRSKMDKAQLENINEDGHTDVASSKRKVMIMVDDSNKLLNKLNGMNKEDSLPSWWSDKITLSQSYLSKATDYLTNPVESIKVDIGSGNVSAVQKGDDRRKKIAKSGGDYDVLDEASLTIPQYKTSIKKLSHSQQDKLFDLLHKLKLMKLIDFINYRDGSLHIAKSSITPKIKKDIEKKFKISLKESVNEARLDPKQLLQQLGGNRFIAMTGAKNLAIDKPKNELHMKIGRNAKGVSHVRIRLTSMDLYDMEFLQVRAGRIKIKSKEKGVYADQLGKMFKKNTGMNVRL